MKKNASTISCTEKIDAITDYSNKDQKDRNALLVMVEEFRSGFINVASRASRLEREKVDLNNDICRLNKCVKAKDMMIAEKNQKIIDITSELELAREQLRIHNILFFESTSEKKPGSDSLEQSAALSTGDESAVSKKKPDKNVNSVSSNSLENLMAISSVPRALKGKASKAGISKTRHLNNDEIETEEMFIEFEEGFFEKHPEYVRIDDETWESIEWVSGYPKKVIYHRERAMVRKTDIQTENLCRAKENACEEILADCKDDINEKDTDAEKSADKASDLSVGCMPAGTVVKAKEYFHPVFMGSLVSASLLSYIIYSKHTLFLPYERISAEIKRCGMDICKQTIGFWMTKAALLLQPLYWVIKQDLRGVECLQADETTALVLEEKSLNNRQKCYFIQFLSGPKEETQIRLYEFKVNRNQVFVTDILDENRKYLLQSDAFSGYMGWDFITNFGCFDHARRPFAQALAAEPDYPAYLSILREHGLNSCEMKKFLESDKHRKMKDLIKIIDTFSVIYHNEKIWKAEKLEAAQIVEKRQVYMKPLLDQIFEIICGYTTKVNINGISLGDGKKYVNKRTKMGKGIEYFVNQKERLYRLLENGNLQISNIRCEQGMKPLKKIEDNSFFYDTREGAKRTALFLTLTETCKLNHLKIEDYLKYVINELSGMEIPVLSDYSNLDQETMNKIRSCAPYSRTLPANLRIS